jgi:hypothetical protein
VFATDISFITKPKELLHEASFGINRLRQSDNDSLDEAYFTPGLSRWIVFDQTNKHSKLSHYSTQLKADVFKYLTDNFVVEAATIKDIIEFIVKNKVKREVLDSYLKSASKYLQIDKPIVLLSENNFHKLCLFIMLRPKDDEDFESFLDQFEVYINEVLVSKDLEDDHVEVTIG